MFAIAFVALLAAATAAPAVESGTECLICEFAIKEVDAYLTKSSTEGEITAWLEKEVCTIFPSNDQQLCTEFLDQFGPQLIDWIAGELSPDEVCNSVLGLGCSLADKPKLLLTHLSARYIRAARPATDFCPICKDFINDLKQVLQENEQGAVTELEKICNVSGALKSVCDDFIQDEAPKAINWLLSKLDAGTVCQAIDACPSTPRLAIDPPMAELAIDPVPEFVVESNNLLGGPKCTYGPSYWCASEENARACNALDHCRENVW